jgi:biopolymer transport protein ExbD
MAEIQPKGDGGGKGGKKRAKKMSTKIDMTPMVDLAFLLLTFFMLTTTFNKPQTMEINMPDKTKVEDDQQTKIKASEALTIILGKNDVVYYYKGLNDGTTQPELVTTDFSDKGIREVLLDMGARIPKLTVLIKPVKTARYKNVVDILDEMNITNTRRYALVEMTDLDTKLMQTVTGSPDGK